jgi:hypothetical protein
MDLRHSSFYRLLAHICNILPSRKISGNDLALLICVHKVNPSRNRASGLLVVPALMRLQQQQQQRKENNDASNPN